MPRFLMVVQSAVLIGDWQRPLLVVLLMHDDGLYSSATPSDTKNRYFSGADVVPAPGAVITPLMAGMTLVNWVSWSLLSFWPLTVIRSILPAADLALDRLDDSANRARSPAELAADPKS